MKTSTIVIVAVVLFLVGGALAGFYIKRKLQGMAEGAKVIIILQRLGQASADLKKQGTFTNDIPDLCDIYRFTNSFTIDGKQYQCALAAKSPSFSDGGVMAITTNDVMLWVDHEGKAALLNGEDSTAQ